MVVLLPCDLVYARHHDVTTRPFQSRLRPESVLLRLPRPLRNLKAQVTDVAARGSGSPWMNGNASRHARLAI